MVLNFLSHLKQPLETSDTEPLLTLNKMFLLNTLKMVPQVSSARTSVDLPKTKKVVYFSPLFLNITKMIVCIYKNR